VTYTVEVLHRGRHIGFRDDNEPDMIHAETYRKDPLGVGHDLALWKVRNGVRDWAEREPLRMQVNPRVWARVNEEKP